MQPFLIPNGISALHDRLICHCRAEHPVFKDKTVLYLGHRRDEASWQLILSMAGADVIQSNAIDSLLQSSSKKITPSKGKHLSSKHTESPKVAKHKLDYVLYALDADFSSTVRKLQASSMWIQNKTSIVTKEFFKECLIQVYSWFYVSL